MTPMTAAPRCLGAPPPPATARRPGTTHALCMLALLVLCVLAGCAPRQEIPQPLQARDLGDGKGVWNFHHRVQLHIPGHPTVNFTGIMRYEGATRTLHVAGVAGLGLQLFALRVTPEETTVEYIHPLLRKIPQVEARMAACLRTVWFDYLPQVWSHDEMRLHGVTVTSSASTLAGLWPQQLQYVDARAPFTLNVRLLQAQQEHTP